MRPESRAGILAPISDEMKAIRELPLTERLGLYLEQRVNNQANWYATKSIYNKRKAKQWFWASVGLHSVAILMLLYRIKAPETNLPIEVMAVAAGAVLTWLQARKHNELNSSYALAAHEIAPYQG